MAAVFFPIARMTGPTARCLPLPSGFGGTLRASRARAWKWEEISGVCAVLGEALAPPRLLASIISGRSSIFAHVIGALGKREGARMGESQRGGPGLTPMALCSLLVLLWPLCGAGSPLRAWVSGCSLGPATYWVCDE